MGAGNQCSCGCRDRQPHDSEFARGVSSPLIDPLRFVADEIAAELSVSKVAGSHRLAFALDLEVHRATADALALGRLDRGKAEEICAGLNLIEAEEFLPALEAAAIEYGAPTPAHN